MLREGVRCGAALLETPSGPVAWPAWSVFSGTRHTRGPEDTEETGWGGRGVTVSRAASP